MIRRDGVLVLPDEISVQIPSTSLPLLEALNNGFGKRLNLCFKEVRENETALLTLKLSQTGVPANEEGYRLTINGEAIKLAAKTEKGLFYGIQTLNNLLLITEKAELPQCVIEDYPSLALRGVFLYLSRSPRFREMVDLFASLKFNTVVLEFGTALPLQRQKLRSGSTLSKEELDDLLEFIRSRNMEAIPHFQMLSHVQWLSGRPDYLSLLENPSDAKSWQVSWCPSNPQVYKIAEDVISETIELIKPRYFHLGMDEVGLGAFRECPECKKRQPGELLGRHAEDLAEMVRKAGATPIFYHDSFLPPSYAYAPDKGDGATAQGYLNPRATVINLWDYNPYPEAARMNIFLEKGFQVYGAAWILTLGNNRELPLLISGAGKGGLGSALTFWSELPAGFKDFRSVSARCWPAMAISAQYCWNVNATPLDKIDFDPTWEIRRRLAPETLLPTEITFEPLPLGDKINAAFGSDPAFPQFTAKGLKTLGNELATASIPLELMTDSKQTYYGIRLSGQDNDSLPQSVVLPINGKIRALALLATMAHPERPDKLQAKYSTMPQTMPQAGLCTIEYSDSSRHEIPLRVFWNLAHWNATRSPFAARYINRSWDKRGLLVQFPLLEYSNPFPDKEVTQIVLTSERNYGVSPVLLAASVSGFTPKVPEAAKVAAAMKHCDNAVAEWQQVRSFPILDFSQRKVDVSVLRDANVSEEPTWRIQSNKQRKEELVLTIPPLKAGCDRGRVSLDFPVSDLDGLKALQLSLYCSAPADLRVSAFYLGNSNLSNVLVQYDLLPKDGSLSVLRTLPLDRMGKEGGGIAPADISKVRYSFWVNNTQPMVIRFSAPIGFDNATEALLVNKSIGD